MAKGQKHGVPAILSLLIPGLGQVVKGQVVKGIAIFVLTVLSVLAMFGFIGFITTPIIYVWNIYDAYNSN